MLEVPPPDLDYDFITPLYLGSYLVIRDVAEMWQDCGGIVRRCSVYALQWPRCYRV